MKLKTNQIRKAVIPAAGFGTRFLPQTKAMPKEMLPIVDKPVIQYVVEELVASGITDIVIVTGWHKRAIEDHFDYPYELIKTLEQQNKPHLLEEVKRTAELANFIYIRQKGPYGNGTPVLCAKNVVGDEPFVVIWGDEFIYANPPRAKQCIEVFEKYGDPVISAVRVPKSDVSRYGIVEAANVEKNIWQIKRLVEKPTTDEAPSNLAAHGCYVLTPDIFPFLEKAKPGKSDEIWLTDAIKELLKTRPVYACEVKNGKYYDTGNKLEYLKTVVEFALAHKDLNGDFRDYLKSLKL
ncbi:MAG: Nucleotidyl transferase [Candidatus Gottesmanbacteria bacterium GW2011_GWB1_43_11]|uniref:UTP--glucose-1-phosphate uridylyltransferase n=1 Tax=Candidatus Gottesmanbacteria bacterium GW2011_GWB1_43_11 TaxID=1618446 RepID=A0A0G1FGV2_9BACT|nr:MAG: Nucleotidyl transferase [Candidatus Gottesmanbacteria bacterium GW2011_GWA1_42_26]KKS86078.1 MAG: Nucleotidyl transferase [Candidatus Gottesmanbacteria bacterium GW2011_GWB1_43_11]OGG09820.1 MAG: UTP--glucose-1-phosphate uridylyltransferase [Candidatus Gottesmanbacteria bacterium RIFCSPHIGHO2_01_FULL_43_15]OGG23549.1 MAG: UTP--glucose-1-phosphate uridylyltransferase [Candidatus Gottesmanbacteria bacterium RIFCSPLOWO2_01_FULL_42_10]HCM37151.1 UTP--glucose-1-phosphate uridylyltransferase 